MMAHYLGFAPVGRRGLSVLAVSAALSLGLTLSAAAQAAPPAAPAAAPAPAPAAPPPGPPPAAGPGDQPSWVKVCNTDPASKKELCLVIQELRAETGQFIASATIRRFTGDSKLSLIAAVPPGMLIQPGIRVQIDTGKQSQIKYGICYANACYGELDIDDDFITSMKGGKQLIITALNQQAKGVSFPMTLAGFTKAFDGKGLDPSEAQARQDSLNKALQARAEEARKKLIEQQQKESGTPAPAQ